MISKKAIYLLIYYRWMYNLSCPVVWFGLVRCRLRLWYTYFGSARPRSNKSILKSQWKERVVLPSESVSIPHLSQPHLLIHYTEKLHNKQVSKYPLLLFFAKLFATKDKNSQRLFLTKTGKVRFCCMHLVKFKTFNKCCIYNCNDSILERYWYFFQFIVSTFMYVKNFIFVQESFFFL